jgi:hypothetical protein
MHEWMPFADRPPNSFRRAVGHEDAVELNVVRSGPSHPEHFPRIEKLHAFALQRYRNVEHRLAVFRIVVDAGGHQDVAGWGAAREHLAAR